MLDKIIKRVEAQEYTILFNLRSGFEMIFGKPGFGDPFVLDLPCLIDVGIMGHCENRCSFCYQGDAQQPNMVLDDFKGIIDCVKDHVNQVALGGRGDPNLHEEFKEIILYSKKNRVIPNYTTSGLNLSFDQIEISKECGAVAVSDYEKDFTYKAISRLMRADIKTNIHMILSRKTLEKAISILKGEDVWNMKVDLDRLNAVIFLLFKPAGRGVNLKELVPTNEDLKPFFDLLKEKTRFKIGMDSCLVNRLCQNSGLSEVEKVYLDTCEAGRMSCYISPDMKLFPCSFADFSQGESLRKNDLRTIWKSGTSFLNTRLLLEKEKDICPYGY